MVWIRMVILEEWEVVQFCLLLWKISKRICWWSGEGMRERSRLSHWMSRIKHSQRREDAEGAGLGSGAGCGANSVSVIWRCWAGHRVSESGVLGRDVARDRNLRLSACRWYFRSVGASPWSPCLGIPEPRNHTSPATVNFGCSWTTAVPAFRELSAAAGPPPLVDVRTHSSLRHWRTVSGEWLTICDVIPAPELSSG